MANKPAAKPASPNQPAPKTAPAKSTASEEKRTFEPKYNWMNKTREWGVRVKPGKAGLKLGDLNVGIYGETPTQWADQSRNPRGAVPRRGMPPVGYSIRDKAGLWADCAADLYEEAIQRRWAPATDVPWNTIEPLPDDVEHAVCQVCTELVGYANVDIETITGWQHQMSYGYHEVKQFLATASFDAARHYECFRKRALANGGGLGLEGPGMVNRMILESRGGWTEAVVYLLVVRGTFTMTLYKYLGRHAPQRRGALHLRACAGRQGAPCDLCPGPSQVRHRPCRRRTPGRAYVDRHRRGRAHPGPARPGACGSPCGDIRRGVAKAAGRGMAVYGDMMRDYVGTYLGYCQWLGVPRDPARLPPPLNEYANPPDAGRHETRRPTGRRVSPQPKPSPNSFGNAAGAANPKNSGV